MTTAVIILNWNGYGDTIECLQSLYRMSSNFYVIVVDNGSTDDSVRRIMEYLDSAGIMSRIVKYGGRLGEAPASGSCTIYDIGENLGFARGNNEALRLLCSCRPDHFLLLNNDTIVEPDFLDRLDEFAAAHVDIEAMTPMICYNAKRDRIWNCGGRQFLGFRKYYYAGKTTGEVRERGYIPVTFLTGCALYFSPSLLNSDGSLLTESFFFGEEDFNFCLRMNNEHRRMACVLTSRIYHKVSNSLKSHSNMGKIYIYYLNRFIDIRLNSSKTHYRVWSRLYSLYVVALLCRKGLSLVEAYWFLRRLLRRAAEKDNVTRADFVEAVSEQYVS